MVYLNGEFIDKADANISVMDRGFLFGDGVYEVIPVYNRQVFRLNPHLDRLQRSLDAVGIRNPYTNEQWQALIERLTQHSAFNNQSVYLQITRGIDSKRAHSAGALTPSVYIEANELTPRDQATLATGFAAITRADLRWQRCDIKATSLLANVMYSQEARSAGVEEVILHRDNRVTEGASSNVFIIKDGVLLTHPTGPYILSGITRDLVLESVKACQINIEECGFSLEALLAADEVWISSSTREVMPITTIDGQVINQGQVGHCWQQVYEHYQQLKHA